MRDYKCPKCNCGLTGPITEDKPCSNCGWNPLSDLKELNRLLRVYGDLARQLLLNQGWSVEEIVETMESSLLTSGMTSEQLRRLQLKDRRRKPLTRAERKTQWALNLLHKLMRERGLKPKD
jgi:hypothetical protein